MAVAVLKISQRCVESRQKRQVILIECQNQSEHPVLFLDGNLNAILGMKKVYKYGISRWRSFHEHGRLFFKLPPVGMAGELTGWESEVSGLPFRNFQ